MTLRAAALALLACAGLLSAAAVAKDPVRAKAEALPLPDRAAPARGPDPRLLSGLDALAPQRPGHPDLYVLGVAGDGSEQVFLNEVRHLQALAAQRLDARGRVLVLANHADQPGQPPLPVASVTNLQRALAGIGERMDVDEDLLLVYFTTHGTDDHRLLLRRSRRSDVLLEPRQIRAALDAAGIRHRVIVISACFSGGFAPALRDPDTLLLMAARRDRPSFGCGNDSVATYFGRAWLVDGLNRELDFVRAFHSARRDIRRRERDDDLPWSWPQIDQGRRIGRQLAAWREAMTPGPALPYPFAEPDDDDAAGLTPLRPAAGRSVPR
ncbi:C13 family peptidase [Arenimonas sp. MALMAid1274]|uniref:C13 family peptidase n=1 Tax=Arenimonas sp. MALMAid1274 TaxID=3411630 RepID=UPI003B9F8C39